MDAYLVDGGTLMDLGMIDNFGNIPPGDIKWKRVRRIISFFQRAHRRFYDKSGRPVGKLSITHKNATYAGFVKFDNTRVI